jgi:hypothetical protein
MLWHVLDPAEIEFNLAGPTQFKGLEGYADVNADPAAIRRAYLREFAAFQQSLQQACRMNQIEYVLMRTDQPVDVALTSFLAARRRRAS